MKPIFRDPQTPTPTRFFPHQPLKQPPNLQIHSPLSQVSSSPAKMAKSRSSESGVVWDCGSSLYDTFELNSLKRQLDSAIIASRTFSMPHLPSRRLLPPSKRPSKISRSLHKFLRSVFRQKPNSSPTFEESEQSEAGFYALYGDSRSAIPEVGFAGFSPEIGSLVRRTASERFSSIGISCA